MANKTISANIKNFLVVMILSFLIWAFAERAVTQEQTTNITLKFSPSASQDILARFLDENDNPLSTSMQINITVQGPSAMVQNIDQDYLSEIRLPLDAIAPDGLPRAYTRSTLNIIEEKLPSIDGKNYLRVIDCEPKNIKFEILKLNQRAVAVMAYDQENKPLTAKITPDTVSAFVLNENTVARVVLDNRQRLSPIGTVINAEATIAAILDYPAQKFPVEVVLVSSEGLQERIIARPRLAVLMPAHMVGQYTVVFTDNYRDELGLYDDISCQGSTTALEAYANSDKHLIIEIFDRDIERTSITRAPRYNIPNDSQLKITNPKMDMFTFSLQRIDATAREQN